MFGVVLILALISIFLGALGSMCFMNCMNKCWASVLYGIVLFITFIAYMAVGGGVTYVSSTTVKQIDATCANEVGMP